MKNFSAFWLTMSSTELISSAVLSVRAEEMPASTIHDKALFLFLGFGFLSFEDEDAVDRCVAEHFVNLSGKQVLTKLPQFSL